MRKILALLVASTSLTTLIGLPAWSTMRSPAGANDRSIATVLDDGKAMRPLTLASDDNDEDADRRRPGNGHGDDDDDGGRGARNPAPAGSVTPPQNGLFGNGSPPQVKVN